MKNGTLRKMHNLAILTTGIWNGSWIRNWNSDWHLEFRIGICSWGLESYFRKRISHFSTLCQLLFNGIHGVCCVSKKLFWWGLFLRCLIFNFWGLDFDVLDVFNLSTHHQEYSHRHRDDVDLRWSTIRRIQRSIFNRNTSVQESVCYLYVAAVSDSIVSLMNSTPQISLSIKKYRWRAPYSGLLQPSRTCWRFNLAFRFVFS